MDAIDELDSIPPHHANVFGESDDGYRLLLDTLSVGIVVIDGKGTVLFVNNAFIRNIRHSRAEVEGRKNIADFIGPDDLEKIVHVHESLKENSSNSPRVTGIHILDRHGNLQDAVITAALIPHTENMMITGLDLPNHPRTKDPGFLPEGFFRRIFELSGVGTIVLRYNDAAGKT